MDHAPLGVAVGRESLDARVGSDCVEVTAGRGLKLGQRHRTHYLLGTFLKSRLELDRLGKNGKAEDFNALPMEAQSK